MFRPRRYGYGGNRGRHDRLPLVLLAGQVLRIGIEHIPPATLGLFAVNTAFHLLPYELGLPSIAQGCLRPDIIMESGDWPRLLWSWLLHASDWHLYYNMTSWLYKGRLLEPRLGTERMLGLTAFFGIGSSLLYTGVAWALRALCGYPAPYYSCAVGFSGVLFAFKVILHDSESHTSVSSLMGFIPVPTRYVYWAELALIQVLAPHSSFLGHLCGIAVGLAYVRGYCGSLFADGIPVFLQRQHEWLRADGNQQPGSYRPHRFTQTSEPSGRREASDAFASPVSRVTSFAADPHPPPPQPQHVQPANSLSAAELRQRRLASLERR